MPSAPENDLLPRVACVLVNWNNAADTGACLASLFAEDYPRLSVLVVDNASTDGSLELLQATYPLATYIANTKNFGFPRACNIGARHALAQAADFVWLLNNDTIVLRGTTGRMVDVARSNPRFGIVGSVLKYMHAPTQTQSWGGGTVSRWTAYSRHFVTPAVLGPGTYLTFASVLIRRDLFDQMGGLFEGAFMYYEDADFCLRARAAGWQLGVAAEAEILHREGGTSLPNNPNTVRMVTTAGLHFLSRHSPLPPLSYVMFLVLRLGKRIVGGKGTEIRAVIDGLRDFISGRVFPIA